MLGNCEKMVLISSIANEWPQNSEINEKGLMGSTGRVLVMEKPIANQDHQTQQQQALKCPRCDSSNTKFCYYNNYSLSQPRHFCKACKRYWTRGGTLRNVPVGGGCRKNKRVKRPNSASAMDTPSSSTTPNPNVQPHVDHISISSTSNQINPLFYGLPSTTPELSLPYPRFNSRVPNVDTLSGYDLHQPQLTNHGIGFSSGLMASDVSEVDMYRDRFNPAAKQIQDAIMTSSNNYSIFGSSTSASASPTIASLLASSLQQQKYNLSAGCNLNDNANLQMPGISMKEVKMEDDHQGHYRLDWNVPCQNQMEQIGSSDPSLYWNNNNNTNNNNIASTGGGWLDPTNIIGPSLPSLI